MLGLISSLRYKPLDSFVLQKNVFLCNVSKLPCVFKFTEKLTPKLGFPCPIQIQASSLNVSKNPLWNQLTTRLYDREKDHKTARIKASYPWKLLSKG